MKNFFLVGVFLFSLFSLEGQHSIARQWNEVLLGNIRNDFARPTVHARNLFHTSVAMYDIWAAYDEVADTYLLGNNIRGFQNDFQGVAMPVDVADARKMAISYAMHRLLTHRFTNSANPALNLFRINELFYNLGYDFNNTSTDYINGGPAEFGNYVAQSIIEFGLQDGSNEINGYENRFYEPSNESLLIEESGNPNLTDPNRWQPLTLDFFIDQAGNLIPFDTPSFLSPEWGEVTPFALSANDLTVERKDGYDYYIYHDPGRPPYVGQDFGLDGVGEYNWGFAMVALWSAHLDPSDGVDIDISPGSIGNNNATLPNSISALRAYYDAENGGDYSTGHNLNPVTGQPYAPNVVKRGDYTRVLAEFWADGPDSETPPGHWFTLLNYVSDHPAVEKRFKGTGAILNDLEWDVKSYLTLGGAMHDCAVAAWGLKGYYDYIRPVSALRYMAAQGQCTDAGLANFTPAGLPLITDYIEMVDSTDALIGANYEHLGKIKIKAWKGPDFIFDPRFDVAGVDWILAENWWPYQRPSFVTPPFAGYVSGHSTFSRAAANLLTQFTGDEYFPGGMGEFVAEKNKFLVFEEGPSEDVVLQWATYQDASDQTSLSRIWGGIHPPADDIPGRIVGDKIAEDVFDLVETYFDGTAVSTNDPIADEYFSLQTNLLRSGTDLILNIGKSVNNITASLFMINGGLVNKETITNVLSGDVLRLSSNGVTAGTYVLKLDIDGTQFSKKIQIVE